MRRRHRQKMRGRSEGRVRHLLQSCENKHSTVEEIVDYPHKHLAFNQTPPQPFTADLKVLKSSSPPSPPPSSKKRKQQHLQHSPPRRSIFRDESDDAEEELGRGNSTRKKSKKFSQSEERLQRMEVSHLRRKQQQSNQDSASTDSSDADDDEDEESEEGEAVSTSEDVIHEQKVEPELDLTKSLPRANYSGSKVAREEDKAPKEKNLELDVVNTKPKRKIDTMNGSSDVKGETKGKGGLGSASNESTVTMEGKEGTRFRDLGGMRDVLEELKMELPRTLGVRPMAGILLYGPPGCGKTKLAHAIANETGVPFYKISATEIVSGVSGASEENIRDLFMKAHRNAPSIVFIDEIDAIASKQENLQREMERRIVTQLMTCMDESHRPLKSSSSDKSGDSGESDTKPGYVLVIGATNRPDAVDPALRRPGRFDREIVLGVPDESARAEILSVLIRNLKLEGSFDLLKIARSTPGFVGADLAALANKAGNLAMKRIIDRRKLDFSKSSVDRDHMDEWWQQPWLPEEMEELSITMADFEDAVKMIQPSSRREGFSAIPNVKWEDVGGLDSLRQAFDRYIVRQIKYPEEYEEFGVDLETGFLLFGPPGCGKTLIAKAVANEAGANFIHIKGPELLNKYVGESELAVRTLFSRARTCSPCILFFDEVDALTKQRGSEGGWVVERLLNQLLIELDGSDHRRGVFVIGATNRIEVIDSAVLRPGRFGKLHYVRLPSQEERALILKALGRKKPLDPDVDLNSIARMEACTNLSGADLAALMNEAAMVALEEKLTPSGGSSDPWTIKARHFERALSKISPSVSKMNIQMYERLAKELKAE
ncbi:hypothetical protein CRG98_010843 [Punica granatum]|uniref:AAA+ ATPase domain-containing protein n=1 Tax=Punica granatum TaxID=22663 RepID=A0A2I0KLT9_PUNGR|nr:hypothetical protein CRG98_010843 [Punica granatum]